MPGFNQTGPMGRGPMTGRGRGLCVSPRAPIGDAYGRGLGTRRGWRLGRGFRNGPGPGYFVDDLPYQENYQARDPQIQTDDMRVVVDRLQAQAETMQRSLDAINKRIAEMEKSK